MPLFKQLEAFTKIQAINDEDCEQMPEGFFTKLLQNCWVERFKKGDYVCRQGEKGDKFYIILEGKVSYLANDEEKALEMLA